MSSNISLIAENALKIFSPFNEPQWDWVPANPITEGTAAQNGEAFEVIKEIDSKLTMEKLSTEIAFGETAAYNYLYDTVAGNSGRSNVVTQFWNPSSRVTRKL